MHRPAHRAGVFARTLVLVLPECFAVLLCIGLVWLSELAPLSRERAAAEASAAESTSNLARAFEENTERVISGIDQILLTARAASVEQASAFNVVDWAAKRVKVDKLAFFLGRVDAAGRTQESTFASSRRGIDISDREHFRAQLDPAHDDLFISKPVIGRATGRAALQFTRKLLTADGRFDGILQVSLDAGELSRFYESIDIGAGYVALARRDGAVLARGPMGSATLGGPVGDARMLAALRSASHGILHVPSDKPGEDDIVSFRNLVDYPLTVLVGFDHDDIYAKYRAARRTAISGGAWISALVLVVGILWVLQRLRSVRARRTLQLTLESISQGIVLLDDHGRMPVINERARQLLGLPPNLPSRPARALLHVPHSCPSGAGVAATEYTRGDGAIVEVQGNTTPAGGVVLTYTDVTERRLAESRIHHLAHHDTLTGLANRLLLHDQLAQLLAPGVAESGAGRFAVLCLDLDEFKNINDTLGHDMGDALLCVFAERVRREVRGTDMLARTGGDEFIVLLDGGAPGQAENLAERIIQTLDEPIVVENCRMGVQASIGIARFPEHGTDAKSLLRAADTALYRAKEEGRGLFRVFDAAMDAHYQERRVLEQELRAALETDQIEIFMQPQFDSLTLQVTGLEALVRWRHPTRGLVPPNVFIPIAEESGLISILGRRVMDGACRLAAGWSTPCRVAVNVSPLQFRDGTLAQFVAETLSATGLPPNRLEVEVTEGVLIGDEQKALDTLRAIKGLGVLVALDDFGTGYSSLGYLRRFPFDRIKIDKSFVQSQNHDADTQAIIDAVLAMTSRLHLQVTAEGVETEEQLNLLRAQGCSELQGFLLGRPMPAAQVPEFLAEAHAQYMVAQAA